MKKVVISLTAAFLTFVGPQATADDTIIGNLITACEADLQNYCSQVTPGEGRLLHCMAAHADKISGRCDYAFYQAATMLQQISVAVAYVATECRADIETHCADVEVGEGRILACLGEHEAEIADSCKTAIADTVGD